MLIVPLLAVQAAAQTLVAEQTSAPVSETVPAAGQLPTALKAGDTIDFAADTLGYSDSDQVITASGSVLISRDDYLLSADTVRYDRTTGQVEASGNVITTDPTGNKVYGDRIVLSESLRDGALDNILLVLKGGGRLAAESGVRISGKTVMTRAVYSPCNVTGPDGCGKEPVWKVRAIKVTHDPIKHRISYREASIDFLGIPVLYLPTLSHPDGFAERAHGLLVPSISYNATLGVGIALPYYHYFGSDRDITLTPKLFSGAKPALGFEYRQLLGSGPVQFSGLITYANRTETDVTGTNIINLGDQFRGYFAANGQFQHSPSWRTTFSARFATDDTFSRRYDISYDDTLRSNINIEHFGSDKYLSIAGWVFEGLRAADTFGTTPIALPLIDFRWNPVTPVLGGNLALQAGSLALTRTDGTDYQRANVNAAWNITRLTRFGQRVTFTGQLRGDVYHVSDAARADLPVYAGRDGWTTRFLPSAALDIVWPFAGTAFGGFQTLTPRVQISASPSGNNARIPNEDSRSVDLNTVDLFSTNRFAGYDRWDGGNRITYGIDYVLERPRFSLQTQIGQSYRISGGSAFIPAGTGIPAKLSDVVARTSFKWGSRLEITQSLRFDPHSLAVRSNEVDVAFGGKQSYVTLAYVKLNRNIAIEDLTDREELRAGGRIAFAKYWSIFGSTILDLTSADENPTTTNNGFSPVRHRIGVAYEDECFRIGISWRHDYTSDRDFRPGNTYQFSISLKNPGL